MSLEKVRSELPQQSSDAEFMAVVARAAADPNVNVDKMERLLAMQQQIMRQRAETEFNFRMEKCQSEMPIVHKDARNSSTNSSYARLESLYKQVVPVITKWGFSVSFGTKDCPVPGHFRVTALVTYGAYSREYQADIPSDHLGPQGKANKTLVHGFGSAMSYGRRYLLMLIFNIATSDDDDGQKAGRREENKGAERASLKKVLWDTIEPIRGPEKNWAQGHAWLVANCGMPAAIPVGEWTNEMYEDAIRKAKEKIER